MSKVEYLLFVNTACPQLSILYRISCDLYTHPIVTSTPHIHCMTVASGWAGQVLARPLFRRPSLHMQSLNTCEVYNMKYTESDAMENLYHEDTKIELLYTYHCHVTCSLISWQQGLLCMITSHTACRRRGGRNAIVANMVQNLCNTT